MLDEILREIKEVVLIPYARILVRFSSPNQMTLIGFFLGIASAYSFATGLVGWGMVFWFANRIVDGFDGTMARVSGKQTDFGGFLDMVCDMVVYALIPIGLTVYAASLEAQINAFSWHWFSLSIMLGVFYVNIGSLFYLSALIEKHNSLKKGSKTTSIAFPTSLIEGTETIVFYTLFMLFVEHLFLLYLVFSFLCCINIMHRLVWLYRFSKKSK